jgi:hypothetical protein
MITHVEMSWLEAEFSRTFESKSIRPQNPREAESVEGTNGKPICRAPWGEAWASGLETMGFGIRQEKIKEEPFMGRTHDESSSQREK